MKNNDAIIGILSPALGNGFGNAHWTEVSSGNRPQSWTVFVWCATTSLMPLIYDAELCTYCRSWLRPLGLYLLIRHWGKCMAPKLNLSSLPITSIYACSSGGVKLQNFLHTWSTSFLPDLRRLTHYHTSGLVSGCSFHFFSFKLRLAWEQRTALLICPSKWSTQETWSSSTSSYSL